MRLGDLDALKKQIKNDYCKNHCPLPYTEYYCPSNCSARYFIKIIDNAPTVNPCDNCDLYFKATTKEIDRWYKKEEQKGGAE